MISEAIEFNENEWINVYNDQKLTYFDWNYNDFDPHESYAVIPCTYLIA